MPKERLCIECLKLGKRSWMKKVYIVSKSKHYTPVGFICVKCMHVEINEERVREVVCDGGRSEA